jgi:hypothetical protein
MTTNDITTTAIEAALAQARNGENENGGKRARLTPEQKAERDAQREQDRAARAAERAEKKASREAEKAHKNPAHMVKVEKAAARLQPLTEKAQSVLSQLFEELDNDDTLISSFVDHVQLRLRARATERSAGANLQPGQVVRITKGSDKRWIGQLATVTKAQRIRCYVRPFNANRDVYLFVADVEPVSEAQLAAPVSESAEETNNVVSINFAG